MSHLQQSTHSPWQKLIGPVFPRLNSDIKTDVCVIGSGISGLTTAYLLLQKGFQVAVIDKESFGNCETGFSTAHITSALDDRFAQLRRWHGDDGLRLAYESHHEAIKLIERIVRDEHIECEFEKVDGYLFQGEPNSTGPLDVELEAIHAAGFTDVKLLDRAPVSFFESGPCLQFPNQAQFHPLKYLQGLLRVIRRSGGEVYQQTKAVEVKGGPLAFVKTEQGFKISCRHIVVATNVPINDLVTMHTKEAAYRTYVIGMKVPQGEVTPALFWDTEDPYHYVRIERVPGQDYDLLIVGGEDHRVGQNDNPQRLYLNLEDWTRLRLGLTGEIVYRWSGQIIEPIDGLAYIGRNPGDEDNVYIASGDSGNGITHGSVAGMILSDLIAGQVNPWASLYDPRRFNWKGLGTYARENWKGASKYADWLTVQDRRRPEELLPGEGAILSDGIGKIAVYRDEEGYLHEFSAACPHLKGMLHWNSLEKTWDCPFHGSRFNPVGEVLNGPAFSNMSPKETSHLTTPPSKKPEQEKPLQ
ncbi:FAD-dependent oxidoreductase [Bdellovibrio sp. HCB337]|uniref:FAD-dependent oxidoreductase n=1 Tax=Bdellovibrio sp. HCB337 TaxID=3394358 RepID=UPI0039A48697